MTWEAASNAVGLATGVAWKAADVATGPASSPRTAISPINPAGAGNPRSNRDLRRERAIVLHPPLSGRLAAQARTGHRRYRRREPAPLPEHLLSYVPES